MPDLNQVFLLISASLPVMTMKNHHTDRMIVALAGLLITGAGLLAQQQETSEKPQEYQFTVEKSIPVTPVKDQHRSGTCWCFATTSFIEAELIRTGKGELDLSEMYYVRRAYELKADKYVRMHGRTNFGKGGLAMDLIRLWREFGALPESAYNCPAIADSLPVHGEMDAVLRGYVDQVITNPDRCLSPVWKEGFKGILDAYLGEVPESFLWNGKEESPRSFADALGLNPDDYVAIGSFTHHPFYESFILEVPDNWLWASIMNLPLDEMMAVLDHAIETGYTACWDADNGEAGFDWESGVARLPNPEITQELRQKWFDNYQTTDEHLMHITGAATDRNGNRFYLVKNSWGTGDHIYQGYLYVSENYMRAKTIFFMVHRDALPPAIADRLNL
jgi:bleomycin hydrolase